MTGPTAPQPQPARSPALTADHHQCGGCPDVTMIYAPPGRPHHHDSCTECLRHCQCRKVWSPPA